MKKFIVAIALVLVALVQAGHAQTVFPLNITVVWSPNAATDNVSSYTLNHNGTNYSVAPSACTLAECIKVITLLSSDNTLALTAINMFGTSAPTTLSFNASAPGKSNNLRIRIN